MTDLDEILTADIDDPWVEENPAPIGARAALGAGAGLGVAALGVAAWSRLARGTWRYDTFDTRPARWRSTGVHAAAATLGTAIAAPSGTKLASTIGTTLGVMLGQLPFILDPHLLLRHPALGNIFQYGMPIAGALVGANVVR